MDWSPEGGRGESAAGGILTGLRGACLLGIVRYTYRPAALGAAAVFGTAALALMWIGTPLSGARTAGSVVLQLTPLVLSSGLIRRPERRPYDWAAPIAWAAVFVGVASWFVWRYRLPEAWFSPTGRSVVFLAGWALLMGLLLWQWRRQVRAARPSRPLGRVLRLA